MSARRLVIAVAALAAVAAAGWLVAGLVGRGSGAIERWCRRQILAIAAEHLEPELAFESLDYVFPGTLHLDNLSLRSGEQEVLAARAVRIELAGIPRPGRPIRIEAARFEGLVVRVIPVDGGVAGFSNLVKPGPGRILDDGGSTKLTDVFAIRRIELRRAGLHYEPPGRPAMRLRPLSFDLVYDPSESAEPGWYGFDTRLALAPVGSWSVDGRLNLDTRVLEIAGSELAMDLEPAQYEVFTPELQELLERMELRGSLDARLSGRVPLEETLGTVLDVDLQLRDARMVAAGREVPVARADVTVHLEQGLIDVPAAELQAFGGAADVHARAWLLQEKDYRFELHGEAAKLILRDVLEYTGNGAGEYRGEISGRFDVSGSLTEVPGSLKGSFEAEAENGRFAIVDLFRRVLKLKGEHTATDRAHVTAEILGNRVAMSRFEIVGNLIAIVGKGWIGYDGTLRLETNAGPLERMQSALGGVGKVLGKLTGKLVIYEVTGTLEKPEVKVRPLGIGLGQGGDEER